MPGGCKVVYRHHDRNAGEKHMTPKSPVSTQSKRPKPFHLEMEYRASCDPTIVPRVYNRNLGFLRPYTPLDTTGRGPPGTDRTEVRYRYMYRVHISSYIYRYDPRRTTYVHVYIQGWILVYCIHPCTVCIVYTSYVRTSQLIIQFVSNQNSVFSRHNSYAVTKS